MELAKTVIRRGEWMEKWMQRSHSNVTGSRLRAVGICSSPLPNLTAQIPPAVCRHHEWPQPSLGFKWAKRGWFKPSLTGHCSDRSLCSGHCSERPLCWHWESPKGWDQHFSFISSLTQRHFLGVSLSTHGTNEHSVTACAPWAVPLALTEFSWCDLGHPQHSHRLFLMRGWHLSAWIFLSWHHQVCHSVNGWCNFYVWRGN